MMQPHKPFKIVLVEPNQARRNYLRVLVSEWGDMAVCFEKETICLDNLLLLTPDIIIIGQLGTEVTFRFLYALKLICFELPVVAITGAPEVRAFIQANGFIDTLTVSPAISPESFRVIIDQLKNTQNTRADIGYSTGWPMIVGSRDHSPIIQACATD